MAQKIYAAKGRPSDNPLIIHIAHPDDAVRYAHVCPTYERLAKAFMPEFLGRVNKIVSFEPLNDAALKGIVNSLCYELNASMEQNYNISTSVTPALQEYVIKKGFRPELGARNIKRL